MPTNNHQQFDALALPWWLSAEESASRGGGDSGSILGQGTKIPCALGQLSLQAETTPHKMVSGLRSKRNPQGAMRSLSTGAGGPQVGREQK